ncbi:Gfo/Idh/MocA family protein [Catenuloplanes atrovinosus]|uniref:Dehydrogenase n=1 Tax=Catenuloplanes atrovinosus TaxID=137266 RepID=A0AAE3YXE5_9ACTN|nr:Gfo/Idh/MocA family oxidoreductase [Catenuloplanes atrovinosus]MDR7280360.1 putative dehydrogenase [Catenuloplanes atrovinosus]
MKRVALIGASGHGLSHRRNLARLAAAGRVEIAAFADPRPPVPEPDAPIPAGTRIFTGHAEMLREIRPDAVVICTPPHTHREIATDALEAGADVLLEKPPVMSLAEHRALAAVAARTGRALQIGFQALGSAALDELRAAMADGRLGEVTGIAALASWQRPDAYYARTPWAGRRTVNGRPSLDGAIANPLAHALMQALALAPDPVPVALELERYRTRPIEVDDTASLRVSFAAGPPVLMAVTLCGEDFIRGEIVVHGTHGRAVLEYPTDRLLLPGDDAPRQVPGRRDLLENLLDDPGHLIAPLARTAPFTAVLEAVQAAPLPDPVDAALVDSVGAPPGRVHVIRGVNAALRAAAERPGLLSEVGVGWARAPWRTTIGGLPARDLQTGGKAAR